MPDVPMMMCFVMVMVRPYKKKGSPKALWSMPEAKDEQLP
jgi:hypothetical protein